MRKLNLVKKFGKVSKKLNKPLTFQNKKNYSSENPKASEEILRSEIGDILKMDDFSQSVLFKGMVAQLKTKDDFIRLLKQTSIASSEIQLEGYNVENLIKKPPVRVAVTGAAGNIGYSLVFRIASGEMLGHDQPVILHLIEIPEAVNTVKGVAMELDDCAFPLLRGVHISSDLKEGFKDVDYALLVGAKPRSKGMERKDLLLENAKIFQAQGKALGEVAKKTCLTLVVGNPANTNALIAASNAKGIPNENFSAMTRLDQNRAVAQVSLKKSADVETIENVVIWGNHSSTQYPDVSNATISGNAVTDLDQKYLAGEFIPTVQNRGAAIIEARGSSSAASAADAAIKHMKDWALGSNGKWVSMAVPSDGSYGVKKGIYCSYPIVCTGEGKYEIVKDLKLDKFSKEKIAASVKELEEEKTAVSGLLK